MSGVGTLASIVLLIGSSRARGSLLTARLAWPALRGYERAALRLTAGLGLTSLTLALIALAGAFSGASAVLVVLSIVGAPSAVRALVAQRLMRGVEGSRGDRWLA